MSVQLEFDEVDCLSLWVYDQEHWLGEEIGDWLSF